MREVYFAAYEYDGERWHECIGPVVTSAELVPLPLERGWLGVGAAFSAYPALRARVGDSVDGFDDGIVPTAAAIGALAWRRFAAGEGVAARDAAPVYIRHRVAATTAERAVGMTQ